MTIRKRELRVGAGIGSGGGKGVDRAGEAGDGRESPVDALKVDHHKLLLSATQLRVVGGQVHRADAFLGPGGVELDQVDAHTRR